jgi:hypothetical protein
MQLKQFFTSSIQARSFASATGLDRLFGRSVGRCVTLLPVANPVTQPTPVITPPSKGVRFAGATGFVFALLQSICTAVLAVSGVRVAIGLTALAAASGIYAPAKGFHQDAIRIPMLILGTFGALINLAVLARVWTLRARASANWRRRSIPRKELRSERLQLALAILTLVLVGLETWTHPMVHRTGQPPSGMEEPITQPRTTNH